jgi:hypothetical protein
MADNTHSVTLDVPSVVNVTLRGFARKLDMTKLPSKTLLFLLEKGAQRGANDPLGAQFEDKPTEAQIDSYWSDLTGRWEKGEVAKTRSGGLGRTTDPVQREIKRLANAEIDASLTKLLVHHGAGGVPMSRKEFDEKLRAKYVTGQIERHKERLEREAKANLAKLSKAGEVELLTIDPEEAEGDEENEGGDES